MSRTRVLIVDSNRDDRAELVEALWGRGFEIMEEETDPYGLSRAKREQPDLVLCEFQPTDGEHGTLLDALSVQMPDTPVIVVTAEARHAAVVEALRLGAVDYLTKPIADTDMIVHAVDSALERNRLRNENSRIKQELEDANQQLRDYIEALQEDHRTGRQVQFGMLPPSPMSIDGIRLQHRIIPSLHLSGDFVDYFRITDSHFVFYIADVSGHGASSAFVTVLLKNFSRRLRREYRPRMLSEPGEMLRWLNDELNESLLERHVTMFLGVINAASGELAYANAGHFPFPALVSGEGARWLELPGKPLGLFEDVDYESALLTLPDSFTIALFSDGVLEVMDDEHVAEKEARLLACVASHAQDMNGLCMDLGLHGDLQAPDDVACLLVSRTA